MSNISTNEIAEIIGEHLKGVKESSNTPEVKVKLETLLDQIAMDIAETMKFHPDFNRDLFKRIINTGK